MELVDAVDEADEDAALASVPPVAFVPLIDCSASIRAPVGPPPGGGGGGPLLILLVLSEEDVPAVEAAEAVD